MLIIKNINTAIPSPRMKGAVILAMLLHQPFYCQTQQMMRKSIYSLGGQVRVAFEVGGQGFCLDSVFWKSGYCIDVGKML